MSKVVSEVEANVEKGIKVDSEEKEERETFELGERKRKRSRSSEKNKFHWICPRIGFIIQFAHFTNHWRGCCTSNEANVEEITEREMHLHLGRYLSVGTPEKRRRICASERVLRSELDSTMVIAHDNIVGHVRDYQSLDF